MLELCVFASPQVEAFISDVQLHTLTPQVNSPVLRGATQEPPDTQTLLQL